MAVAPYALVCAVQDLHDLYLRVSPVGPYRMELFHDVGPANVRWGAHLQPQLTLIDQLIRAASCLLANDLAPAALPTVAAIWRGVRELERSSVGGLRAEPAYYRYLTLELQHTRQGSAVRTYRLFGEVLAVYLDVLGSMSAPGTRGIRGRVAALRGVLVQMGESPSSSSDGPATPPGGSAGG